MRLGWEMGPLLRVARVQDSKARQMLWDRVKLARPSVRELEAERALTEPHRLPRRPDEAGKRSSVKSEVTPSLQDARKTVSMAASALARVAVNRLEPREAKALDRNLAALSKAIAGLRERLAR